MTDQARALTTHTDDSDFLMRVLARPSYGYGGDPRASGLANSPYRPTKLEVVREFLSNVNIIRSKKNWPGFITAFGTVLLFVNAIYYFAFLFSWPTLIAAYVYMFHFHSALYELITHRAHNHRAIKFRNRFFGFLSRMLILQDIPPEVHHIAHQVHHQHSDKIGDPYNARMGAFCLWFSDFNHQKLSPALSERDYQRAVKMVSNVILFPNSYSQYKKWGSISHPFYYWIENLVNWCFWWIIFLSVGGLNFASAMFTVFFLQVVLLVRRINYLIHAQEFESRNPGSDFGVDDLSRNNPVCGIVFGNWHSNHHLYPRSARTGFTPWQFDLPFWIARSLKALGVVTSICDNKDDFISRFKRAIS